MRFKVSGLGGLGMRVSRRVSRHGGCMEITRAEHGEVRNKDHVIRLVRTSEFLEGMWAVPKIKYSVP